MEDAGNVRVAIKHAAADDFFCIGGFD